MEPLELMPGISESVPKTSGLPPFVTDHKDRHGKHRLRYRRKGVPVHYFKHPLGSREFWAEYDECEAKKAPVARIAEKIERIPPGSISALIAIYYSSPEFTGLAASTQATYRGILNRFRETYGDLPVRDITRRHIKEILGSMADRPGAANNLLDRLRAIMTFAMDLDPPWIDRDPTARVKGYRIDSDGFHSWTEAEIEKFMARHPSGTKGRLALALMLYTGQRRSDAVLLGRQRITGKRLNLRQEKTGEWVSVPILPELARELARAPKGNMTFLLTEYGKPFSAAGFGNWFRTQCDLAGLPQCSAHGLRKAAARRLAEAGCTHEEIKSITGHRTDKEVTRYVEAANKEKLSASAMDKLQKAKKRTAGGQP